MQAGGKFARGSDLVWASAEGLQNGLIDVLLYLDSRGDSWKVLLSSGGYRSKLSRVEILNGKAHVSSCKHGGWRQNERDLQPRRGGRVQAHQDWIGQPLSISFSKQPSSLQGFVSEPFQLILAPVEGYLSARTKRLPRRWGLLFTGLYLSAISLSTDLRYTLVPFAGAGI